MRFQGSNEKEKKDLGRKEHVVGAVLAPDAEGVDNSILVGGHGHSVFFAQFGQDGQVVEPAHNAENHSR
jgi:hypothetical protein